MIENVEQLIAVFGMPEAKGKTMTIEPTEKFLTPREICEELQISRTTVSNYVHAGCPVHYADQGLKRVPRFLLSEVREWIRNRRES